jgi:hypothetical protein
MSFQLALLAKIAEFWPTKEVCGQEFGPLNFFVQGFCQLVKKIGHPWFGGCLARVWKNKNLKE